MSTIRVNRIENEGGTVGFNVDDVASSANAVDKGGDTMTGPLEVPAGAVLAEVPQVQEVVTKSGDTMTGNLTIGDSISGNKLSLRTLSGGVSTISFKTNDTNEVFGQIACNINDPDSDSTLKIERYSAGEVVTTRALDYEGNVTVNLSAPTEDNHLTRKDYVDAHADNVENPHAVTKDQVGLGSVDDTSDADKPISTATSTALDGKLNNSEIKGGYYGTDNADNTLLVNEDIWGDTSCGIGKLYIDCLRAGDMATVSMDLEIVDFSQDYPTDDSFAFDFDLASKARDEGWFQTIDNGRGIFNLEVTPGDSSFSTGRVYNSDGYLHFKMGETAQGSTDMTATEAYVHCVVVLRVAD